MSDLKAILLYTMALFYIVNGLNHFANQETYLKIMPPYVPWHKALVMLSGAAEIILGLMLFIPSLTRFASWGIILLLIAIFPANLHMALNSHLYSSLRPITLYLRLPLQLVFIAWAFWYS